MNARRPTTGFCLVILALFATTSEARLYRWVDEAGSVHYTDTLPPAQAERGHAEMSDKGVVVDTKEPAKAAEEVQKEQEFQRLRAAAQRAKEQQEAADQFLLRTFGSVDDIVMARDGKLASIDAMVHLTRANIRRQQDVLRALRGNAADLERAGKPTPRPLSDNIDNAEKSIRQAYTTIIEREQQKQDIVASSARDAQRYRQLKRMPEDKDDQAPAPMLKNLVACSDAQTCDQLWDRASAYTRQHATTSIQASTQGLLMTAPAVSDADISLTLSRLQDSAGPGAKLFLDAQCKPGLNGNPTCTSPEARRILDGFSAAVLGQGG
jgi:hypothetical protein